MSIEELKEKFAGSKEQLKERFKVKRIGIFGSYVREEQRESRKEDNRGEI